MDDAHNTDPEFREFVERERENAKNPEWLKAVEEEWRRALAEEEWLPFERVIEELEANRGNDRLHE